MAGEGLKRGEIIQVNDDVIGKKRKLITGCGSLHCIALFDPYTGALLESYLSKGSTGGCNNFMIGLSRMISISARGGIDIYTIIDQLNSTGACPSYTVRRATREDTSKGPAAPWPWEMRSWICTTRCRRSWQAGERGSRTRAKGAEAQGGEDREGSSTSWCARNAGNLWFLREAAISARAADGANVCKITAEGCGKILVSCSPPFNTCFKGRIYR